jgi:hypothetical protein
MSFRNTIFGLAAVGLLSCQLKADELPAYDPTGTSAPSLQASLRNGEIIGVEQVRRAYLTFGTNEFVFVIPHGFRMDASNPEKIVLSDSNYNCFLTVRIAGSQSGAKELSLDTCRQMVMNRHPGAKISEELSQSAGNRSGPAFDFQWENSSGTVQSARIAYIPSPAGILEFSVLSEPAKFTEGKSFFNFLLLTFRTNEHGKLETIVFSDKS